jgi:hypothetical protein
MGYGNPLEDRPKDEAVMNRLAAKTERDLDTGCWWWKGARKRGGYGHMSVDDHMKLVHRLAWELTVGPIPDGHEIDHLCKNRSCLNPAHLEPVTKEENVRRGKGNYAPESKTNPSAVNRVYLWFYEKVRMSDDQEEE